MKVALVHDYIKEYGGAEKVLEELHAIFPDAPVFTSVYCPSFLGPHRERFASWDIRSSILQYIPFKHKLISPFRLITPLIFKQFDFSKFDVVIVSATGAYNPNLINKSSRGRSASGGKSALQICYCHTPPRYLYGYPTAREWKKNKVMLVLGTIANHFLRIVDVNSSRNVDYFIANSHEVAARIKKFYHKDATVIYPPVDIRGEGTAERVQDKNQKLSSIILSPKPYFLTGSRMAKAKHIDLLIKTCTKYNLPLKVFGKAFAGYEEELKDIAGESIEFLGEVSNEEKFTLMREAKAFLFASEYEDFGIIPVEAMGQGTQVIAYKSGGVKETVIDGKTGIFFEELTVESLKGAIDRMEKMKIDSKDCIKQAEKFNSERFKKEIKEFVTRVQGKG